MSLKYISGLPKIQTKRPNLRVFRQKDANVIANSEDPDQTNFYIQDLFYPLRFYGKT